MTTLHIEHPITDYPTWRAAFDRFADARTRAGVRAYRIQQPVDDAKFVVIDLDFDSPEAALRFHALLRERVWSTPENSPGLGGEPRVKVLELVR